MTKLDPQTLMLFEAIAVEEELKAGYVRPSQAPQLEARGWKAWLMTLFPFWFSEDFSAEHEQYWELHWITLQRIKRGETVENRDLVKLLLLGRGLGKSSVIEAARIMRGAILNKGYSLIVSETDDQAQEHLGNCRILIEHPDSRLLTYYPDMAVTDNADVVKGMPTADRKEMFICKNGYILRAKGLAAKMRGLRVGVMRPDDIALDDIDDVNDSLAVSTNKLRLITASILPVQARENVTVDVGQNLISEHSVVNQIYTGKTDALADRTVIGVANAFTKLDIDSGIDETGKMRHRILETSIPSWAGFSVIRAQKFLDNSGINTFLAEYQNQFDQFKSGRVISNYSEEAQVITWSMFEKMFSSRRIPAHWNVLAGLDVGYSDGQHPHYSAWVFIATAAQNSALPNSLFVYRGRSFVGTSIDDQVVTIKSEMHPDEKIVSWQMSHERTGEMMTLKQKYNVPFDKFEYYKSEDGVAQWKHLSMCDKKQPNPFKNDTMIDGEYLIGRPQMFYIVDDDQLARPVDDRGLRLMREQISTWEYVTVKLTENGQTLQRPSKVNDDFCFVAGTKIKTLSGDKNIEDVQVGDYALTRKGYRPIVACGMTNVRAEVRTLTLSDGRTLEGTDNHPIYCVNRGYVALADTVNGDRLVVWEKQSVSFLMASRFFGILNRLADQCEFIFSRVGHTESLASPHYIGQFGNFVTDQFRRIITSITGITTRLTTTLPISNVYHLSGIPDITALQTAYPMPALTLSLGEEKRQRLGILREKGLSSIAAMGRRQGLSRVHDQNEKLNAGSAEGCLNQAVQPLHSVVEIAGKIIATRMRAIIRSSALIVQKLSKLSERTQNIAVQSVATNTGEKPVYNLTVDDAHEYFANGVLVHNCDCTKSLLAYFGAKATPLNLEEQIHTQLEAKIPQALIETDDPNAAMMMTRKMHLEKELRAKLTNGNGKPAWSHIG